MTDREMLKISVEEFDRIQDFICLVRKIQKYIKN